MLHNLLIYKMTTGLHDHRPRLVLQCGCWYYGTANMFFNNYQTSVEYSFRKAVFYQLTLLSTQTAFKKQECLDFRCLSKVTFRQIAINLWLVVYFHFNQYGQQEANLSGWLPKVYKTVLKKKHITRPRIYLSATAIAYWSLCLVPRGHGRENITTAQFVLTLRD